MLYSVKASNVQFANWASKERRPTYKIGWKAAGGENAELINREFTFSSLMTWCALFVHDSRNSTDDIISIAVGFHYPRFKYTDT